MSKRLLVPPRAVQPNLDDKDSHALSLAFSTVIRTGATLSVHHIQINEAKDAAQALVPLVGGNGHIAEILFAVGLLNASLVAASVLSLSTAYWIAEAFGWERGV